MKKMTILSYIFGMVVVLVLASCQSNETRKQIKAADPQEPVVINTTTTTKLEKVDEGVQSGMGSGYAWSTFNGVFITERPDVTADDPTSVLREETKVGGISRSTAKVNPDTTYVDNFDSGVSYELTNTTEADLTSPDSIGASVTKTYSANDGAVLPVVDLYKYVAANVTLAIPHYEPSSQITGVRYEATADPDVRIVWTEITVTNKVVGTTQGTETTQVYEIGRYQKKAAAVDPADPFEVRLHNFDLFRTYRKKTQHSICEGFMSFAVYNARTGELVEEISTDGFSSQLAKCGHFGAPTNGYIIREASVLGNAPTSVTENVVADNEEALSASYVKGNFKLTVTCTSQDYYVHFPVRGRDDSEGGIAAGGQNLFFTATCVYTNPETGWTKTWEFTHRTEVNVKGWQTRTPQVDRSSETVNDVDGVRNLQYAGTYVVEFINRLYLNGEEVVQENGDEDYYFQSSKVNGSTSPFHVSEMAIDCWTSYLP